MRDEAHDAAVLSETRTDAKRRARCGVFTLEGGVLVDNRSPCP